jgi:hypothetical protein
MTTSAAETRAQRAVTAALIAADHVVVSLVPRVATTTPSGTKTYVDGTPRAAQQFKLSELSYDQRPTVTLAGGVVRTIDYHLIGLHTSTIELNDWWTDDHGTRFDVVGFSDGFTYERKAYVTRTMPPAARP